MARIRLRNCFVRFIDGFSAAGVLNEAPVNGMTDLDVVITGNVIIAVGSRFEIAGAAQIYTVTAQTDNGTKTTNITFTPALATAVGIPTNGAAITFQGRALTIKVDDGNLSYDTGRNLDYEMDRGKVDAVVEGDDEPVSVNLDMTYEFLTAQTGSNVPTPEDVLKHRGEAADWVTAGADPCENYAIKIEIDYAPPCSVDHEITVFPEFRYETLSHDLQGSSISVRGRCKVKDIVPFRRAY